MATESRLKCFPSKVTGSSFPSPLIIWIISSRRLARRDAKTPAASHSRCCSSLNAPPTPAAIINRPPDMRSTVPSVCASKTGWRRAINSTAVPRRTRLVRAATAAKVARGSIRGLAVRLSPTHTESRPPFSARHARSIIRSALCGGVSVSINPRVGSNTPNFNAVLESAEIILPRLELD